MAHAKPNLNTSYVGIKPPFHLELCDEHKNLNTSYVSVKPCIKAMFCFTISNLNTSCVSVKQINLQKHFAHSPQFKYILC